MEGHSGIIDHVMSDEGIFYVRMAVIHLGGRCMCVRVSGGGGGWGWRWGCLLFTRPLAPLLELEDFV